MHGGRVLNIALLDNKHENHFRTPLHIPQLHQHENNCGDLYFQHFRTHLTEWWERFVNSSCFYQTLSWCLGFRHSLRASQVYESESSLSVSVRGDITSLHCQHHQQVWTWAMSKIFRYLVITLKISCNNKVESQYKIIKKNITSYLKQTKWKQFIHSSSLEASDSATPRERSIPPSHLINYTVQICINLCNTCNTTNE